VLVRFIRSSPPYNVGDTAGFYRGRAEALVKGGKATPIVGEELAELKARDKAAQDALALQLRRQSEPATPPPVPQKQQRGKR
jgi:hypothetical protein